MDLDPRNYDLGELRGPPAKRDSDAEGSDHDEADDREPTGSTRSARGTRNDVPARPRSDESDDRHAEESENAGGNGERTAPDDREPAPSSRETPPPTGTRATRSPVGEPTDRYRRLVAIERTFESDPEKPYLTALPTAFSDEVVIFEWLTSLLDHAGHRNTIEALRYYREIGWITERVETTLRGYLGGFDAGGSARPLTASDHLDSLLAIAQLASTRQKK